MKNMWKERFDNCKRVMVRDHASKEHEMWRVASEIFGMFAMKPLREDAITSVEDLGAGVYKVTQVAPDSGYWSEGYRCESLVKVYKRGNDTYVKLLESKRLRIHENTEHDGFIVRTMARGRKVLGTNTLEARFVDWLTKKAEL